MNKESKELKESIYQTVQSVTKQLDDPGELTDYQIQQLSKIIFQSIETLRKLKNGKT